MKEGGEMPFEAAGGDLRPLKTKKAINDALYELLEHQNFKKLTVKKICEKAVISRVAFYTHYADKYDLLEKWMGEGLSVISEKYNFYAQPMSSVNSFVEDHKGVIKNIVETADTETLEITLGFLKSLLDIDPGEDISKKVVMSSFLAGGLLYYINWYVKNNFSAEFIDTEAYSVIREFKSWASQRHQEGKQ